MTDESIATSRPRRAQKKRVQSELFEFPKSTRNIKKRYQDGAAGAKAQASSSRSRIEQDGHEDTSSETHMDGDAESGPEEVNSGPEDVNSVANDVKNGKDHDRRYRGRISGPVRAQRRFPNSFMNVPAKLYGLVPDAEMIHERRKEKSEAEKNASSHIAAMVSNVLQLSKKKKSRTLTKDEAQKYMQGKKMNGTESFLKPTEETFAAVEEGTELISNTNFTELLPFIGNRLSVKMGLEKDLQEIKLKKGDSVLLNEATEMEEQEGVLFNVGSHVYSMDWSYKAVQNNDLTDDLEYICVSAALDEWPRTRMMERIKKDSKQGVLQIWSISKTTWQTRLEMKLCFDGGRMSVVRWVPISEANSSGMDQALGLLSVTMQDGNVALYSVPYPHTLNNGHGEDVPYVKLDPILVFCVSEGSPLCLEWQDSQLLAVGYSDGHVAIWNLRKALQEQKESIEDGVEPMIVPEMYIRASRSPIADLTWGKSGEDEIYVCAYDGSIYHATLSNSDFCQQVIRSRDTLSAITFEPATNLALHEKLKDCCVQTIEYPQKARPSSRVVYPHYGRVRTLHTSPHHPFLASGGSDGTVRIGNVPALMLHNARRWAGGGTHTLFRLDVSDRGSNGSVRFIEPLATFDCSRSPPEEIARSLKMAKTGFAAKQGFTMAWHPAVNVTSVRWNLNSGCETWLASGMALGLVRVDVVGRPAERKSDDDEEEEEEEDADEEEGEAEGERTGKGDRAEDGEGVDEEGEVEGEM